MATNPALTPGPVSAGTPVSATVNTSGSPALTLPGWPAGINPDTGSPFVNSTIRIPGGYYKDANGVYRLYAPASTTGPSVDTRMPGILSRITYQPLTGCQLGKPIPLGYGRFRTGGNFARIKEWPSGGLMILVVWCEGEIEAIEKVYSDDVDITTDYVWGTHLGTASQTGDAYMDLLFGQADDLKGIAYSVVRLPAGYSLNLQAVIKGKKIWDPRTSSTSYKKNAALVLANFIDEYTDYDIDWDSVEVAADYCDVEIATGVKRWEINMPLADAKPPEEWIAVLAEYANCYAFLDNGTYRLLPDEPRAVDHVLTAGDIVGGSFDLKKAGLRDTPTQVIGDYLLPDAYNVWTETSVYTAAPDESSPLRITRLKLGAFAKAIQCYRKIVQFYNYATQADLTGKFRVFDRGAKITKGDVISVTHPIGLTAKEFRVLDIAAYSRGRWQLDVREYSALCYSEDVVTDPAGSDTTLPDPRAVPNGPTITEVKEVLFTDQNSLTFTRFEIRWSGVTDYPWIKNYRVQVTAGSVTVMDIPAESLGAGIEHLAVTPPTAQGVEYTIKIWVTSTLGGSSATPGTATKTGAGDTIPPSDPSGLTGREAAQFVSLAWTASVSTKLRGYQIRKLNQADYDAAASGSARWNHANVQMVVERHGSTRLVINSQAVGGWYYMVKGESFAGVYSTNFTAKLIQVTEDQGASIQETTLDELTLVNMHLFDTRRQEGVNGSIRATTSIGEDWVTMFGAAGSKWTDNFSAGDKWTANHNVASSFESEIWDTGKDNSGNWIFQSNIMALGGATLTYTTRLAKVADYPTFTDISGQSVNGEGRYYKAKVEAASALGAAFSIIIPIDVTFAGVIVKDKGAESVPSSPQPVAVSFAKTYGIPPVVHVQLLGSTPGFALPDAVTTTGFDLYVWDVSGANMAGDVTWDSEGA